MKITKSQLQEIIREELNALSEEENLDEFLGGLFGKKKKQKPKVSDEEEADEEDSLEAGARRAAEREARRNSPEAIARRKKASLAFGGGAQGAGFRANKIAGDRKYREEEDRRRREAERRRKAGTGTEIDYARKTDRYGVNNRKDESKVRQQIREEVAKVVKAHFNK